MNNESRDPGEYSGRPEEEDGSIYCMPVRFGILFWQGVPEIDNAVNLKNCRYDGSTKINIQILFPAYQTRAVAGVMFASFERFCPRMDEKTEPDAEK